MSYETAGACRFLARGQIVFLVWVTFDKRKWVILAERRGLGPWVPEHASKSFIFSQTRAPGTLTTETTMLRAEDCAASQRAFPAPVNRKEKGCFMQNS
jgi:hypothetical protein